MATVAAEAVALFKAKRFAESLPLFDKHIKEFPSDKVGFCNRAQVHVEMKNYEAAIKDAEQSLTLDPAYAKAYKRKADAFIGLNKKREAMEVLLDASKLLHQMGASHDLLTEPMNKLNRELGGYISNLGSDLVKWMDVCAFCKVGLSSKKLKGPMCPLCKRACYCSMDHLEAHKARQIMQRVEGSCSSREVHFGNLHSHRVLGPC